MQKAKIKKISLIALVTGVIIIMAVILYMFNMPHQSVLDAKADYHLSAEELVKQYLSDPEKANELYLSEDGQSKIIAVDGTVKSITENMVGQVVVLLQDPQMPAGINCTFDIETSSQGEALQVGERVSIKGVIRSGAAFDDDLDMYEHVLIDKSSIFNN